MGLLLSGIALSVSLLDQMANVEEVANIWKTIHQAVKVTFTIIIYECQALSGDINLNKH